MVVAGCMRDKGGVTKKKIKKSKPNCSHVYTRGKRGILQMSKPKPLPNPSRPSPRLARHAFSHSSLFFLCQPIGHTRYPSLRQSGCHTRPCFPLFRSSLSIRTCRFSCFFPIWYACDVCVLVIFLHSLSRFFFLSSSTTNSSHSSSISQAWPSGAKLRSLIFLTSFENIKRSWAFADTLSGAKQSLRGSQSA